MSKLSCFASCPGAGGVNLRSNSLGGRRPSPLAPSCAAIPNGGAGRPLVSARGAAWSDPIRKPERPPATSPGSTRLRRSGAASPSRTRPWRPWGRRRGRCRFRCRGCRRGLCRHRAHRRPPPPVEAEAEPSPPSWQSPPPPSPWCRACTFAPPAGLSPRIPPLFSFPPLSAVPTREVGRARPREQPGGRRQDPRPGT